MSDINVDSFLAFSVLLDDEMDKIEATDGIKKRIQELLELSFKAGFRAGQKPENNLGYRRISK
jgi:hypothetical protein